MKHRKRGKQGLKYEHQMIPGLREVLEQVQGWPEVASVIPARIRHTGGGGGHLWLTVQTSTTTGIKVLAHGSGAVQEVFIVSRDRPALSARIEREFGRNGGAS